MEEDNKCCLSNMDTNTEDFRQWSINTEMKHSSEAQDMEIDGKGQ